MQDNSHTILVVDPDERSYKTFESVLGVSNRVLFVQNGQTAIDLPDTQNIDVIFVSDTLNGINGIMLLEAFKKKFPSLPVVFITEQPQVKEVITAFRSGARELIVKPIDAKELATVTQKILGFVSNKKPKSRRFLSIRKAMQPNSPEKNYKGYLKKIFQKSKEQKDLSVTDFDGFQAKEAAPKALDSGNQLMDDPPADPVQPDKVTHLTVPPETMHLRIEAFFFGPFQIFVNNQPIENWPSKKGKSIFAYLILNHKRKIFRDVLMDIFWKKSCPDSARNCLNVTIHGLRRILEDIDPKSEFILFQDECYYLNPAIDLRLDVEEFRKRWRHAQSVEHNKGPLVAIPEFERAAGLYKGDFLEDEIYDSWSSLDRENLREIYLIILDRLSNFYTEDGQISTAIYLCERIIQKDNCREDIHRRLMQCHYYSGQRFKAIRQFRKCKEILKKELEVEPDHRTVKLYEQIKKGSLIKDLKNMKNFSKN